jgi:hypothetical protein
MLMFTWKAGFDEAGSHVPTLYFFAGGGGGGCGVVGCSARHGACRSEVQADSASATSAKATEILLQCCTEGPGGHEYEEK